MKKTEKVKYGTSSPSGSNDYASLPTVEEIEIAEQIQEDNDGEAGMIIRE